MNDLRDLETAGLGLFAILLIAAMVKLEKWLSPANTIILYTVYAALFSLSAATYALIATHPLGPYLLPALFAVGASLDAAHKIATATKTKMLPWAMHNLVWIGATGAVAYFWISG